MAAHADGGAAPRRLGLALVRSLKAKLMAALLAVSLIPITVIGVLSFQQSQDALYQGTLADLGDVANVQAESTRQWVADRMADMQVLAGSDGVKAMQASRIDPQLKQVYDQYKIYETLFVTDRTGRTVSIIGGSAVNVGDRAYFQQAMQGKNVVSDPVVSKVSGNTVVVVAVPARNESGEIAGIVAGAISLASTGQLMAMGQRGATGESYLVNGQGFFVTPSRFAADLKNRGLVKERAEMEFKVDTVGSRAALSGKVGAGEYEGYTGAQVIGAYSPIEGLGWAVMVEQQSSEAMESVARLQNLMLLIALAAGAIAIIAALVIAGQIAGTVSRLAALARQIAHSDLPSFVQASTALAAGDLTSKPTVTAKQITVKGKDELSMMTTDVNHMVERLQEAGTSFGLMTASLRNMVGQVQETADGLAESGTQLGGAVSQALAAVDQVSTTIQHVAQSGQQQASVAMETSESVTLLNGAITEVATGAEQQVKSVLSASATAAQMADSIKRVASESSRVALGTEEARKIALDGSQLVQNSVAGIVRLKETVENASRQMDALGQASQQISAVVETIDEIAEQTNLLALNAAIEAARAGEHGRGFAVVADEVRKLAEKSSMETKQISQLVTGVQVGIEEAVDAMHGGAREAQEGSDLALQAGRALDQIVRSVETTVGQTGEIAREAQEMASASAAVAAALESIASIAERARSAAGQMESMARKVTHAVDGTASAAEENSAASEEMSASAEAMAGEIGLMGAQADALAKTASDLRSLVARFNLNGASSGEAA